MRCGICHATLTVRGYRTVDVGNSNSGKRRVPLYHPCPRLNDLSFHPAHANREGPWDQRHLAFGARGHARSKRPLAEQIAHAEAMASRYLGNYNEELEAGRPKGAEKMLAKSQYWLDRANDLRGQGST